jgi:hypothetical protein
MCFQDIEDDLLAVPDKNKQLSIAEKNAQLNVQIPSHKTTIH